ncbi:MAG: hypothetical protein IV107_16510 [Paucibacter sp.]|nr:hypothetical protein [Roseateles sp.]
MFTSSKLTSAQMAARLSVLWQATNSQISEPPKPRPDMNDRQALETAVNTAAAVATRTATSPAAAAMEVTCAFLIVRAQLDKANGTADQSFDKAMADQAVADALLVSAGFDALNFSPEAVRAMSLLGLQPLLRIRQSSDPSETEPRLPPRMSEIDRAVMALKHAQALTPSSAPLVDVLAAAEAVHVFLTDSPVASADMVLEALAVAQRLYFAGGECASIQESIACARAALAWLLNPSSVGPDAVAPLAVGGL